MKRIYTQVGYELDDMDLAIVRMVGSGYGNADIAIALHRGEGAIKHRLSDIFLELGLPLGLNNRVVLAVWARDQGLCDPITLDKEVVFHDGRPFIPR